MRNPIFKLIVQHPKHWIKSTRNISRNIKRWLSRTKVIPSETKRHPSSTLKILPSKPREINSDLEFNTTYLTPLLNILVSDLTYKLYSMDPVDVFHVLKLSLLVEPRGSSPSPWTDLQEIGKSYESCVFYHHKMIPHIVHHCLGQCFIDTNFILNNIPPSLDPGYPIKIAVQNVLKQLHVLNHYP